MNTLRQVVLAVSLGLSLWTTSVSAEPPPSQKETAEPPSSSTAPTPTAPSTSQPSGKTSSPDTQPRTTAPSGETTPEQPSLNFDLLGPSTEPQKPAVNEHAIKLRRTMLKIHQVIGFGLVGAEVGSIITGQLNYSDKFTGDNSNRFTTIHQVFVYPTVGLGTVNALLGVLAPQPFETESHGFDRMTLHKIGMFTAYAGWITQLALGLVTANREGFANQRSYAIAHLAVGYVTLAGTLVGVGAIVF